MNIGRQPSCPHAPRPPTRPQLKKKTVGTQFVSFFGSVQEWAWLPKDRVAAWGAFAPFDIIQSTPSHQWLCVCTYMRVCVRIQSAWCYQASPLPTLLRVLPLSFVLTHTNTRPILRMQSTGATKRTLKRPRQKRLSKRCAKQRKPPPRTQLQLLPPPPPPPPPPLLLMLPPLAVVPRVRALGRRPLLNPPLRPAASAPPPPPPPPPSLLLMPRQQKAKRATMGRRVRMKAACLRTSEREWRSLQRIARCLPLSDSPAAAAAAA
jgi:hypothetical protein